MSCLICPGTRPQFLASQKNITWITLFMKSQKKKVCVENVVTDEQCQYYSQNWGWGGFTCYSCFKISIVAYPSPHNFEDKSWPFTLERESNFVKFCNLRNAVPHFKTVANYLIQINFITVWLYKNKCTLKSVVFQFQVRNILGHVIQSTKSQENIAISMSLMPFAVSFLG